MKHEKNIRQHEEHSERRDAKSHYHSGMQDKSQKGDAQYAAECAHGARTAPAGSFAGGKPPSGPRPEPVRTNGIRAPKERNLSE